MKKLLFMLALAAFIAISPAVSFAATTDIDLATEVVIKNNMSVDVSGSWFKFYRSPVVGSYVTLPSFAPGLPCYEWSSIGNDPGNPVWWFGRSVLVVFVGYSCDGTPNGNMIVRYTGAPPYTNAQTEWYTF